jgi:hypothetical protein
MSGGQRVSLHIMLVLMIGVLVPACWQGRQFNIDAACELPMAYCSNGTLRPRVLASPARRVRG